MFGPHERRMIDAFVTQFESDGKQGYYYHYAGRGPGIPVSGAARDAFIDAYRRENRRNLIATTIGGALAIVAGVVAATIFHLHDRPLGDILLGCLTAILIAVIAVTVLRSYAAPRRALEGRAGVGADRSREEAKAMAIAARAGGKFSARSRRFSPYSVCKR